MDPQLPQTVIFYALFFVAILATLSFGDTTARDAGP